MPDPEALLAAYLEAIDYAGDPELTAAPARVTELLREFRPGQPPPEVSTFPAGDHPGPVILDGLAFHSLCAHHLTPFFGDATVAYLPGERIAGLGSIARLLHHHARRPQLQERLTDQLADDLWHRLAPRAVVVRLRARQMCMELRGARTRAEVTTWAERGQADDLLRRI